MRRISKKRVSDNRIYKEAKKDLFLDDLKRNKLRCFFSDKPITILEEIRHEDDDTLMKYLTCHHLNQERENERLYDKEMMVPVLSYYHNLYHSLSVEKLLELPWYLPFLMRLKMKSIEVYRKELYKQVKASLISEEYYEQQTT